MNQHDRDASFGRIERVDLRHGASTLPELPKWLVPRDNLIALLRGQFGADRKIVAIKGPLGAGKTTLLAQFVEEAPDRCLSFFVGRDMWSTDPERFMYDFAQQLAIAVGETANLALATAQELRLTTQRLISRLARDARISDRPYYIVVDSIDQSLGEGARISDVVPAALPRNVYLLVSTEGSLPDSLREADIVELPNFSIAETTLLFDNLNLTAEEIAQIHTASRGFPAYLAEVRRDLASGMTAEELMRRLPENLAALFDRQWESTTSSAEDAQLLGLVAFAPEPLSVEELASLMDRDPSQIHATVESGPIVTLDSRAVVVFATDWHRRMAQERLADQRAASESLLIEIYEADPHSERSLRYLPALLQSSGRYERVKELITNEYLSKALASVRDLYRLRVGLSNASVGAALAGDTAGLTYFATAAAAVGTTVYQVSALTQEIRTLAALGDYEQAVAVAESALLPQDQLQALGYVARSMRAEELAVPSEINDRLDELSRQIPDSTPPEEVARIAASFFDVRPDAALRMIERCVGNAGEHALDRALLLLSLRSSATESSWQSLRERFSDPDIREWATTLSLRDSNITAEEILARAALVAEPSGRLFLLREWCNRNRANPEAVGVVTQAVQLIAEVQEYTPSLRILRQLTEPLRAAMPEVARPLAERIGVLSRGLPASPLSESLRLRLLLAGLEWRHNFTAGAAQVLEIIIDLETVTDLEIRCFGYAQALALLVDVDPTDVAGVRGDVLSGLRTTFSELVASTGDHEEVSRRTLEAVTRADFKLAVELARTVNTRRRRSRIVRWVLRQATNVETAITAFKEILEAVEGIEETFDRDGALMDVVEGLSRRGSPGDADVADLLQRGSSIGYPAHRARACAAISTLVEADSDLAIQASSAAQEAWDALEYPWERASAAVIVIERLTTTPSVQRAIAGQAAKERSAGPGTNSFFAAMYTEAVMLTAASMASAGLSEDALSRLTEKTIADIRRIPSPLVRCELHCVMASRLLFAGNRSSAERFFEAALEAHGEISDPHLRTGTVPFLAGPLAYLDPEDLKSRLRDVPPEVREIGANTAIAHLLTRVGFDIEAAESPVGRSVRYSDALFACDLIELVATDQRIYWGARTLADTVTRGRQSLNGRQLHEVAARLEAIARTALPDKLNISHDGYRTAVLTQARRLQEQADPRRTGWDDLEAMTAGLDNVADRSISWLWFAQALPDRERERRQRALLNAERDAAQVPAAYDRASHLKEIAEERFKRGEKEAASTLLKRALGDVEAADSHTPDDEIIQKLLELADSIDPDMASSLTPLADDAVRQHSLDRTVKEGRLYRRPADISQDPDPDRLAHMIGRAASRLRGSLAVGRGVAQPRNVVTQWLATMASAQFSDATEVAGWAVENAVEGQWASSERQGFNDSLIAIRDLVWQLGTTLCEEAPHLSALEDPGGFELFKIGDRDQAVRRVREWLSQLDSPYLWICDGYFTVEELWALRATPTDTIVRIVTGLRPQKGVAGESLTDTGDLAKAWLSAWRTQYQQSPPATQVFVMSAGREKTSPIHDRYLIGQGGGLSLGTSLSGLGRRDSSITELAEADAARVLREMIEPWLAIAPPYYKGERVISYSFPLLE